MKIFESIINQKINTITAEELLKYSDQFNIKLNRKQANKIVEYLRGKNINIFDDRQRATLIKAIARAAGPETAREVNKLFIQFSNN